MEPAREFVSNLRIPERVPDGKIPHFIGTESVGRVVEVKSGDPKTDIKRVISNLALLTAAALEKQAKSGLLEKTATRVGGFDEVCVTYRSRAKEKEAMFALVRVSGKGEVRKVTTKNRRANGETTFTEIGPTYPRLTQAEISSDGKTQTLTEWGDLGGDILARRVITARLAPKREKPPYPVVQVEAKWKRGGSNFLKLAEDHIGVKFGDRPLPVSGLFGDLLAERPGTIAADVLRRVAGKEPAERGVREVSILPQGGKELYYRYNPTRSEFEIEGGGDVFPHGEMFTAHGFAVPAKVPENGTLTLRPAKHPTVEPGESLAGSRELGQIRLEGINRGPSAFSLYDMPQPVFR